MNSLEIIAHIKSDFPTKFGIPRQSGMVEGLRASIVFMPEYRNAQALRGLETFSYLWLLWDFSQARQKTWSPTVRPPKLGGNTRVGVFATRSPYRPNSIGLSSVKLDRIELETPEGPVLHVLGADLMDGTPIYDIKPYLPFTDSHADAAAGFLGGAKPPLRVKADQAQLASVPEEDRLVLRELLAYDPRPAYQDDPERIYGIEYKDWEIKFRVAHGVLTVTAIESRKKRRG